MFPFRLTNHRHYINLYIYAYISVALRLICYVMLVRMTSTACHVSCSKAGVLCHIIWLSRSDCKSYVRGSMMNSVGRTKLNV